MRRDTAWALLTEMTQGESLLKHARTVENPRMSTAVGALLGWSIGAGP